ncbi:serine protease inhibitor Cvsi-2-like [Saccostrea cucullata]|uniref:serine protease inhibitor Cvsi-2-like n=1 Tax=Saccostrea cuccullata TaxID=36930 RepID=UPI002ECFE0FE
MKTLFVLAVLIAAVYSENCRRHDDCTTTTCGTGSEIHCIFHTCTCTTAGGATCTMASDCHDRCTFGRQHHCIDGHCRCTIL